MRLDVSRKADLAVQMLVALAGAGRRVKAGELADDIGSTRGFVPHIAAPLVARGWVTSGTGPTGGYACAVSLDEVSVLEVIEAVEGATDSGACVLEDRPCDGRSSCALHGPWQTARAQLRDQLASVAVSAVERRDERGDRQGRETDDH
jgi:Rrf2 family iron-sulfur cluster assembly transcriptional regulator